MKKNIKIILIGIIVIVLISIYFYPYFTVLTADLKFKKYGHKVEINNATCGKYIWIFKDSLKSDIDTTFSFSLIKDRDIYNHLDRKSTRLNSSHANISYA